MEVLPSGFGGTLTVVVGINADGTVAGAQVTKHAETPGLGAKAQADPTVLQFAGQAADGSLAVTKDGGSIVPITGRNHHLPCGYARSQHSGKPRPVSWHP